MTDKMREQFEEWIVDIYSVPLDVDEDGDYCNYRAADAWQAWKASRASIEVELPRMVLDEDGDYVCYPHDVRMAIAAQGIKVKP